MAAAQLAASQSAAGRQAALSTASRQLSLLPTGWRHKAAAPPLQVPLKAQAAAAPTLSAPTGV